LEPSFGAICLEDIFSPACFLIEEALRRQLQIPVYHDRQHGAATVCAAALLNALRLQEKKIEELRLVIVGTGPSGIGCANLLLELGVRLENLVMVDHRGTTGVYSTTDARGRRISSRPVSPGRRRRERSPMPWKGRMSWWAAPSGGW
ncbi:MAG: malic enzyme-like NAD(P)-binding protein, partial [Planctomycetota bacterium]